MQPLDGKKLLIPKSVNDFAQIGILIKQKIDLLKQIKAVVMAANFNLCRNELNGKEKSRQRNIASYKRVIAEKKILGTIQYTDLSDKNRTTFYVDIKVWISLIEKFEDQGIAVDGNGEPTMRQMDKEADKRS